MVKSPRLIQDTTDRYKLKVSLASGRYQLSLDDRAVALLMDSLGFATGDSIPHPIAPIIVAMDDAWFPNERDFDNVIADLQSEGHLTTPEQEALGEYVTTSRIQERHVDRVLTAVAASPLEEITEEDLRIQPLPSLPPMFNAESESNQSQ